MTSYEYQVIPMADLLESPTWLAAADTKIKETACSLTRCLNHKDSEGWELVSICATDRIGFAVFKRSRKEQ